MISRVTTAREYECDGGSWSVTGSKKLENSTEVLSLLQHALHHYDTEE